MEAKVRTPKYILINGTQWTPSMIKDRILTQDKAVKNALLRIYSFQTLEEHHFIGEGFSNDFAHWAFTACNEPGLAERLASVDVREFTSVADLRERIVHVVAEHLRRNPRASERAAREPFYFCASDTAILPTPFVAHDLAEFVDALGRVSVHSVHHHFIEARLRVKLTSNDFSLWLEDELGRGDLGRRINGIDIYTSTLEGVRGQIIGIVQRSLA